MKVVSVRRGTLGLLTQLPLYHSRIDTTEDGLSTGQKRRLHVG